MNARRTAGGGRRRREPAGGRRIFLLVSMADVIACNAFIGLKLAQAIWLLNLPATITIGRLASIVAGDQAALVVTVPAGAALYGWAGVCLYRRRLLGPAEASP